MEYLYPKLQLKAILAKMNSAEPTICEVMFHCTMKLLAVTSYHNIRETAKNSKASSYSIMWHTIELSDQLLPSLLSFQELLKLVFMLPVTMPTPSHRIQDLNIL